MKKSFLILANGAPLPKPLRDRLRKGRTTVALDGAANLARKEGWKPDVISGDFDSIDDKTLKYFSGKATLLHTPDQNFTDLEKAMSWCLDQGAKNIWIAQSLGKRLDHSLTNLAVLKKFHRPGREILCFTETEIVRFLRDEKIRLTGKSRRGFALIPFPSCRARSKGLKYELTGEPYRLGEKESVSNQATGKEIRLDVRGEALVIEERM